MRLITPIFQTGMVHSLELIILCTLYIWIDEIKLVETGLRVYSDHAPTTLVLQLKKDCPHISVWRRNNFSLKDKDIVGRVQKEREDYFT